MKFHCLILLLGLASLLRVEATAVPEGKGIMYGGGYAFTLVAPKGWILDNSVAQGTGVCAVFYPQGSSWKDSPVVCYVNTREKTPTIQDAADVARDDMNTFHRNGSPNSKVEKIEDLRLTTGTTASIWEYTGDKWNNYERTAFFVEPGIINEIVITARTQAALKQALPSFKELVSSYVFVGKFVIKK